MLKTPIDLSDYEDVTVEADIQSLKDFLDQKDSWMNPTKYTVIEYFPPQDKEKQLTYSPTTYRITNLIITDIEDGTVLCDGYLDDEDIMLFENMVENDIYHVLNNFHTGDIIMISINKNNITISMDSGYIQILY